MISAVLAVLLSQLTPLHPAPANALVAAAAGTAGSGVTGGTGASLFTGASLLLAAVRLAEDFLDTLFEKATSL